VRRPSIRWVSAILAVIVAVPGCIRTRVLPSYGDEDSKMSDVPAGTALAFNFDRDVTGGPAAGFAPFFGAWGVLRDDTAPSKPNVYAQTSKGYEFPGTIVSTKVFADFDASVQCKMLSGLVDAAGGLIFRFQNPRAYYVVRANVLENDLCLYRCVSGVRQPIMSATVKLQKDQWYKIGIQCQDENIRCYLDDKLLIEGKDKKFLKGKIGLWSKADSVTYFDNLEIVAK
jgi:hypothetical protein